jgi:hypothetical protein
MERMITSDSGRQFLKEACAAVSTESETDRFDLEGAIQALLQANRHLRRQLKAYDEGTNPLVTGVVTVSRPVGGILSAPCGAGWPSI